MRVLVIGGSGFIGSAIVEELLRDPDNEVHTLDRQIREDNPRKGLIRHEGDVTLGQFGSTGSLQWDNVVNLAVRFGTSEMFQDLPGIVSNIKGALNVLSELKTGTVLYPVNPEVWMNPYTVSKISARLIHEMYATYLGRKCIMVRLFNVYGPGQRWEPVRFAVPNFIMRALRDEPITIYGSGEQTMDLTYSVDVARAFVALMKAPPESNYHVVEVGTGVGTSVAQCAKDIVQCTGSKSEIVHTPMRKGEDSKTLVVCSNPYSLSGGYSNWPVRLTEVVEWYNDKYVHRDITP